MLSIAVGPTALSMNMLPLRQALEAKRKHPPPWAAELSRMMLPVIVGEVERHRIPPPLTPLVPSWMVKPLSTESGPSMLTKDTTGPAPAPMKVTSGPS